MFDTGFMFVDRETFKGGKGLKNKWSPCSELKIREHSETPTHETSNYEMPPLFCQKK